MTGLPRRSALLGSIAYSIAALTGAALTADAEAAQRAILIGIEEYQHVTNLQGPVEDAKRMQRFAIEQMGFSTEETVLVTNQDATLQGLRDMFRRELIEGTSPGDRILIYYSGHGGQVPDLDGDEEDQLDETLVSVDGYADRTEGHNHFTDDEFGALLAQLTDRDVTVIIDACHSGTIARGENDMLREGGPTPRTPITVGARPSSAAIMAHRQEESFVLPATLPPHGQPDDEEADTADDETPEAEDQVAALPPEQEAPPADAAPPSDQQDGAPGVANDNADDDADDVDDEEVEDEDEEEEGSLQQAQSDTTPPSNEQAAAGEEQDAATDAADTDDADDEDEADDEDDDEEVDDADDANDADDDGTEDNAAQPAPGGDQGQNAGAAPGDEANAPGDAMMEDEDDGDACEDDEEDEDEMMPGTGDQAGAGTEGAPSDEAALPDDEDEDDGCLDEDDEEDLEEMDDEEMGEDGQQQGEAPPMGSQRIWSAAAAFQYAWEVEGEGLFTRFFIEGAGEQRLADANGNGIVSNAELIDYVRDRAEQWCAETEECANLSLGFTPVLEASNADLAAAFVPFGEPVTDPTDVIVQENTAHVAIEVLPTNHNRVGDQVSFRVTSEHDGYLILLDINAEGDVIQLIPNDLMTALDESHEISEGEPVTIPEEGSRLVFTASPPVGEGLLIAIVAEDDMPLAELVQESRDLSPQEDPQEYLGELARTLMKVWSGDEANRELNWSMTTLPYSISK